MKNTLLLLILITSFACTKKVLPDRPISDDQQFPKVPASSNVTSTINIPISVPLSSFQTEINNSIPQRINIAQDVRCPETPLPQEERCRISGGINLGQVSLDGNGNNLQAAVDISGSIRFDIWYRIDLFIGSDGRQIDKNLHFAGRVNLTAEPTVGTNWSLQPNLNARVNYREAYIRFGPKISVRGLLKDQSEPLLNKELDKIERKFSDSNNLKKLLTPYWQKLAAPIALSGDDLWLTLNPKEILYKEIDIQNDTMNLGVGLVIDATTYIGPKPADVEIGDIPDLRKETSNDGTFNINLPVLSQYTTLSTLLNESLGNKTIDIDDEASISFQEISIFGDTSNLYIKTAFNAKRKRQKAKGNLYFKASPQLENGILKLSNVDFDVKTRNVLVKSLSWLLQKKITEEIESKAKVNLTKEIDKERLKFNEKYGNFETDELLINAELENANVVDFSLQKEGIFLQGMADGTLQVDLKNLKFD